MPDILVVEALTTTFEGKYAASGSLRSMIISPNNRAYPWAVKMRFIAMIASPHTPRAPRPILGKVLVDLYRRFGGETDLAIGIRQL